MASNRRLQLLPDGNRQRPERSSPRPGRITRLALIGPYDPAASTVGGVPPVEDGEIRDLAAGGYRVVAADRRHAPSTHAIKAGKQDYLAALSPNREAPTLKLPDQRVRDPAVAVSSGFRARPRLVPTVQRVGVGNDAGGMAAAVVVADGHDDG